MAQRKEFLYKLQIVVSSVCPDFEVLDVKARKDTTSEELIQVVVERLKLDPSQNYDLAEVMVTARGQTCKERRLEGSENPVAVQLLWPKPLLGIENDQANQTKYSFCLREKQIEIVGRVIGWGEGLLDFHNMDSFLSRFLHQPWNKEYPDLCNLPDLNEHTLLENLKARFFNGHIYTYVGSILIAVNPFKFYPIYNPKYVKLYQNRRLGELPPHIFAIADSAYHTMLRDRANQCIVISGESGSGKTESTNFLLHHLTALSQKGHHGSGVEQTILGAGPVLEAFGNAKTAHNNNSSRFGKFIQVNYKENGMVHGAVVQKYLLEKSRIVSQAKNERNYHVFYYLLAGASEAEKEQHYLGKPEDYFYLNQSDCYSLSGVDENYEFARLKQSMEMVGFATETQKRLFCVLSAVLHLGNIQFTNRSTYYHDESVSVKNPDLLKIISNLLRVKEETLMSALTSKKTIARTETLVINYKMHEAIATRDALAKCLYGALFDWIVLQVNHALMAKKDTREHHGNAIGVLDIFGFENFENNSFEQFCINFANEHLQYYFNEHVFRFEQDEYKREGICWKNIDFVDNTGCLNLIEGRPTGLLSLIDEECNFPGGTNETLIEKFNQQHKNNDFYEVPQKRESAFIVNHYAGKVKYSTKDFREKNSDLMRPDIVSVLKNSSMSFVRELVGIDPVAVFRWAILRAFFRSVFVFINAGKQHRKKGAANKAWRKSYPGKIIPANENMLSISKWSSSPKDGSVRLHPLASLHDNVAYELEGMRLHGVMTESQAKVFHRANRILMKHKSFKPKLKANKCLKDLQALKTLTGKSVARSSRKQPPTVGAQFQASLSKLMETLNQANPFFVRCMKSNGEKAPCKFDKEIILRQLRYTGMLETVRIRRCGYNVRLTFEEFIQVYRIILPSGLLSSRAEVVRFLETMNLNKVNYQLGLTKLFFRESEKVKLDEKLHMEIMHRIVAIQYWWKTILERRQFLRLKVCTIRIQSQIRCYLAQRKLVHFKMRVVAAIFIQKFWRGYCCQRRYEVLQRGVIWVQRVHRGNLARQRYWLILEDRRQQQKRLERDMDLHSSQSDEGILTKENSQEELNVCYRPAPAHDSEESSGILDDSETESMASESHHQPQSLGLTPPISPYSEHYTESPPSPLSPVEVRPYSTYGEQIVPRRRVSEMSKAFSTGTTEEKTKKSSKKNSAKKMKPIKSPSSDALYTQDKNIDHAVIRRQTSLTDNHHFEERENSLKILPSNMDQREVLEKLIKERESSSDYSSSTQRSPVSQHKGRFHKARQHLKTFIGGGKKPMKRPTCVTDDSEDSQTEDQLGPTLKNSHDVGVLPVESVDEQLDAPEMKEEPVMKDIHSFKHAKFHKGETCSVCCKNFTGLFTQGSKCIVCKLAYHQKCMQNAGQCLGNKTSPRVSPKNNRKVRKHSKTSLDMKSPKKWNLTGTSEFTDRADQIISDVNELRSMDSFIFSKITRMSQDGRRDTIVDVVFKTALKEFHRHLVSTYSVAAQDGNLSIKYKDLIVNFEQTMATVCKQKNTSATFPVTMGINAFRGFLDEFMNLQKVDDKPKYKTLRRKRKEDKKKGDLNMEHLGHNFMGIVMNIPTACEYCSSFMWLMERGMVCHSCKLTCHKKCCNKVTSECQGFRSSSEVQEDYQFRIFRVPLSNLVSDDIKIPVVVEKLISSIELKGLYTEGIYRKSGSNAKVKLLRLAIDNDLKNLNLDLFAVHVLTTTLKLFFREMPESLMTSDLYDDFLRASDLTDSQERIRTFYSIIQKLPKCNHNLLERLIFHLARVAQHEEANRMSANSLAIVFAPCILRTNKQVQAQDSLNDVSRQTMCVEVIIEEQLRKLKATLEDIDTLESATATASNRLSALRSSKIFLSSQLHLSKIDNIDDTGTSPNEEEILSEHIRSLEQEKALLTTTLPRLTRNSSDDDMISGDDLESTFDSIMDEMEDDVYEEYALTFDLPVSPPTALRHLNKHRADVPMKRKPSRFSYYNILSSQHDSIPSDTTIVSIYHPASSDLYEDDVIMV